MSKVKIFSILLLWIFFIVIFFQDMYSIDQFNLTPKKLPVTGAEPLWEPDAWNNSDIIKYNNCYAYFLDDPIDSRVSKPQPGYYGIGKSEIKKRNKEQGKYSSCDEMDKRILSDNSHIYKIDEELPCKKNFYKGFLAISPGNDYHFYRQDSSGLFSHKRGNKPVTNKDSDGNLIINPRLANREYSNYNYNESCNYYCIPKNSKIITNSN